LNSNTLSLVQNVELPLPDEEDSYGIAAAIAGDDDYLYIVTNSPPLLYRIGEL